MIDINRTGFIISKDPVDDKNIYTITRIKIIGHVYNDDGKFKTYLCAIPNTNTTLVSDTIHVSQEKAEDALKKLIKSDKQE